MSSGCCRACRDGSAADPALIEEFQPLHQARILELSFVVAAGTAGGLGTVVVQQALWPFRAGPTNGSVQLARAAVHTVAGAGLGLLFWLSWGLVALVNISWWQRGLAFGVCAWGLLALPAMLLGRMDAHYPWRTLIWIAAEMLSTCALAGLACAWAWAKAP